MKTPKIEKTLNYRESFDLVYLLEEYKNRLIVKINRYPRNEEEHYICQNIQKIGDIIESIRSH